MPRKSGKSRASATSCKVVPLLLRNRNRLRAVDVANILTTLCCGDFLRSCLLAGLDGPLSYAIALCRGESAHADRATRGAARLRELETEFASTDSKYFSLF